MSEHDFMVVLKVMANRIALLEYELEAANESKNNLLCALEKYRSMDLEAEASNG